MIAQNRNYFEKIPGFIVATDNGGGVLFSNEAFEDLAETFAGTGDRAHLELSKDVLLQACRRVAQSGTSEKFELSHSTPGGPIKWYSCEVVSTGATAGALASCHEITGLKTSEQQLRHSRDLLLDTEGIASFGTWEWDICHNSVIWSDGLYQIYDVKSDSYKPGFEAFLEKVHADDRERVREAMTNAMMRQIPFSHDERIVRPDGSVRYLHSWGQPFADKSGNLIRMVGVCQDRTEQIIAETKVRDMCSVLRATLDSTADGILVMDLNEKIVDYNTRLLDLWNLPQDFFKSKTYSEALDYVDSQLTHPEECRRRLAEIFADRTCESHDVIPFKDGRIYERISRPQRLGNVVIGRVFSYRDITARIRNEEQIHRYSEQAKLLADASKAFTEARLDRSSVLKAVCGWLARYTQDGVIIRLIEKGMLSVSCFEHSSAAVTEDLRRSLPAQVEDIEAPAVREMLKSGKPLLIKEKLIRSKVSRGFHALLDRYPIHCWLNIPLRVAGQTIGIVTLFRYRSEQAYSTNEIEFICELANRAAFAIDNAGLYAEARRAVQVREDFISVASHELKTPLTPLKMQLQLLRDFLHSAPFDASANFGPLLKMFDNSDEQVVRLCRLIEDMIDVSRITTGRMALNLESCDLGEIVREVVERFRPQFEQAGCAIELKETGPAPGRWDKMRIEQILNNILSNAIKYGRGKPVKITVSCRENQAQVSFQDFGIGIAQEDHKRIFERFERAVPVARYGGLGLGLFIARQIAEAHSGRIWVESKPGQGSTFHLELPGRESTLSPHEAGRMSNKLMQALQDERMYLQTDLRLRTLADRVGIKSYRLTELIQSHLKTNFYDLVNSMRVDHAKTLLEQTERPLNIAGIAAESGFNSKSVFNEVFKKFTGITPSEYRKSRN